MRRWLGATLLSVGMMMLVAAQESLPGKVDVSGAAGANGMNGSSGSSSGADGTSAGPSTPGQHSGRLVLEVRSGAEGQFVVRGQRTKPRSQGTAERPPETLEWDYAIGDTGFLGLRAVGGGGGRGGDGGDGARGSDGSDGSDATCSSSGGSGGRGGDGGDGGNATSGSGGGDGGDVTVSVSPEDTHLLLLLVPSTEGGRGGFPGRNGSGGAGGRGGSGGSSHSSHGEEGANRCNGNSGGSDGSSGASGASGYASVSGGANGKPGRWTIQVGGVDYDSRYRLRLTGFTITSLNQDGVIEPGELVRVSGLGVRNEGGVPSPPPELHETRVYVPLTRNVSQPSEPLLLPLSLKNGQETEIPGELRFRVPDVDVATAIVLNERYSDTGEIDPRAKLLDARRDHPEFPKGRSFDLGFPVGVRPLRLASAFGAGESHRFFLEAENLSTRAYGAELEDAHSRRVVRVGFSFAGRSLDPGAVVFRVGPEQRPVDLGQGPFTWPIPALKPGERARLEVSLAVKPDAPPYAGAELNLDLWFGQLDDGQEARVVERRQLPLRVAARWQDPKEPSLLLVTNVGVELEAVRAWRELAASIGLGLAIWDVSYYGFLPLGERVADRSDVILMDAVPGQLMVVLNNTFSSPMHDDDGRRVPARAARFLRADGVTRAVTEAGVRALIVGKSPGNGLSRHSYSSGPAPSLDDLLVPKAQPGTVQEHPSRGGLFAALAKEQGPDVGVLHRLDISEGWFWGEPQRWVLEEAAEDLQSALRSRWPERRYLVASRFRPALDEGALWNSIDHGQLEVRRTQDGHRGGVSAVEVPDEELRDGGYVASPELLEGVLGAMSFERKLELLQGYLDGALPRAGSGAPSVEVFGRALGAAILADLRHELDLWTRDRWSGLSTSGTYRERMTHHAALAKLKPAKPLPVSSPRAACVEIIVRGVRGYGSSRWGFWDVVVPFCARRYYAVAASAGTALGDGLIDEFAENALAGPVEERALVAQDPEPAPRWSHRRGQQALDGVSGYSSSDDRVLSEDEAQAVLDVAVQRTEERQALLDALDRLHAESFMPEELDRPADGGDESGPR